MKNTKIGAIAMVLMTSVLATPTMAMEMTDTTTKLVLADTCEERIDELQQHRDRKAAVHEDLNLRQDDLEARAAEIIAKAQEKHVSTTELEKAIEQSRSNEQKVDTAYKVMDEIWATAQENACNMTEKEFAKMVNYQNPSALYFEKLGQEAGEYINKVVEPLMAAVTDEMLKARK